jgi:hypothetical protein
MTSTEAATAILNGVRKGEWRLLVGEDAHKLDEAVRNAPDKAYDADFFATHGLEFLLGVMKPAKL